MFFKQDIVYWGGFIKVEKQKLAFFLPNIFTGLNLFCGLGSILLSQEGDYFKASLLLILGAVFDCVDGRIARMTGTQSHFGEQFDSMSDMVSFGVAPAFLIYHYSLASLGRLGGCMAFAYVLCSALRLARFNANIEKINSNYFQGLPTPGAAMGIVGYVLLGEVLLDLKNIFLLSFSYTLLYSCLMISNLPFCSFKDSEWVRKYKKGVLVLIFLLLLITFSYYKVMIITIMTTYIVGSVLYYLRHKGELSGLFVWKNDH